MRNDRITKDLAIAKENTDREMDESEEANLQEQHLEGLTLEEKQMVKLMADLFVRNVLKNGEN